MYRLPFDYDESISISSPIPVLNCSISLSLLKPGGITAPRNPRMANAEDYQGLFLTVAVPEATPEMRNQFTGLMLHIGIHLTESTLSLFPIVGEYFLALDRIRTNTIARRKLRTGIEHDRHQQDIDTHNHIKHMHELLAPLILPFIEVPAYMTQSMVEGADLKRIIRSMQQIQQEHNVDVHTLLNDLEDWAYSQEVALNPLGWKPFINGSILFGLLPNIATANLLEENPWRTSDGFAKDALEMIKGAASQGKVDMDPFAEFPELAFSYFRREFTFRGISWYGPWNHTDTLHKYIQRIKDCTSNSSLAWARAVHNLADVVGTQRSLPVLALNTFPFLYAELMHKNPSEDVPQTVNKVWFIIADQQNSQYKVVSPENSRIISELLVQRAIVQSVAPMFEGEPDCIIKSVIGDLPQKDAEVYVTDANCQECSGCFVDEKRKLYEKCAMVKLILPQLDKFHEAA